MVCICCIKKVPFIRNKLTFIYRKWITEPDNDEDIKKEIEDLIPEFVNINSENHNMIYHRKPVKKFKRKNTGPKFTVPQFDINSINKNYLYIFKANENNTNYNEVLMKRKNKLFLRQKRAKKRKQKVKKSHNTSNSNGNEVSLINNIYIDELLRNHEFIMDDTVQTRRSRNITITTQFEFL